MLILFTEVENVKSTLRSDVERFHTQTYNEVLVKVLALKNQHHARITKRPQHWQNLPSSSYLMNTPNGLQQFQCLTA